MAKDSATVYGHSLVPPLKLRRHADGDGRGRNRDDGIEIELFREGFEEFIEGISSYSIEDSVALLLFPVRPNSG